MNEIKVKMLFMPAKSKHVIKENKKRRKGKRTPRSTTSCPGPNNLPPLQFHHVHGDNIRICRDGTMAKRYESFCKGITFSARPVKINERVYVKFSEISNNWSGVIRFGFTANDPATLRNSLPKYACPDLTNRPGYWAKALNERFCERDNILFYYVTSAGDVYFGINGEEKGVFINGVETRGPLWTLIDIYGNCSAIEFLDSRIYMYQQQNHSARRSGEPMVDSIIPTFQSVSVSEEAPAANRIGSGDINRWSSNSNGLNSMNPIPFHRIKGRNVGLSADRLVATRSDSEYCQGYVFTARPLRIGEKIIVQILRTEYMYTGSLALGLTSCDPASLQSTDLPDDSEMLLDRPEYWVVSKDVGSSPVRGDEITFCVTVDGEVQISKNGGPITTVMHVDQSLQLWMFLDVYGSTQSVRLFSQSLPAVLPTSPRRLQVPMPNSESVNSLNSQVSQQSENQRQAAQLAAQRLISLQTTGDMLLQTGGTVLVVNLPPAHSTEVISTAAQRRQQPQVSVPAVSVPACTSATLLTNYSNTYEEPISCQHPSYNNRADVNQPNGMVTSPQRLQVQLPNSESINSLTQQTENQRKAVQLAAQQQIAAENSVQCAICYENPIDSVLYMCGHMCMCYNCAIQQWRGIGGGHCPLCRAVIRDVIRTYKS
ncbi:protein neuralized isoform X2 [Bradysia coprophila]|uniref:protein neuralized isoform X2 n=1 Tax=Bradysia coprophila TaxID=38358 RepID=UPI00187DC3B4|nr:protein neuralized isoform X2 [Bradysia coprophila]